MRPIVRTTLVIACLAMLCGSASMAMAQKAKKGDAAPAKGAEDEIELEDSATPDKPAAEGEGEIELEEDKPVEGNLELDQQGSADPGIGPVKAGPVTRTPVSWKDILVVIRKPFLKVRRIELSPFIATTMNDNMVRHNTLGLQANYYLTDVLAVGVEGQLYTHQFREPFDLVGRQARRLPTVNQYNWSGALNFHYVPVYGKFAVLDKHLLTWEVFFTAGIGAGQSSVIARDRTYPGFDNFLIQPNVGVSMRFFLSKFLTVTLGFRDYIFIDKFEPANRSAAMNATADQARDNADSSLINNVMFQLGVSIWLPMSFEYTTFR